MEARLRIEICGGIATGKTTLARALTLAQQAAGARLVLEDFRANPFWQRFYDDPTAYLEEKNICFLAQHCGEIKGAKGSPMTICDYAVLQDLAYARLSPRPSHLVVMTALFDDLYEALPKSSLLVHLQAPPEIQLHRIRARARPEEAGISTAYLTELNAALKTALSQRPPGCPVYTVDSDQVDFAHDSLQAQALSKDLLASIGL